MSQTLPEIINVPKLRQYQASYKYDCLHGSTHPLSIEEYSYRLLTIHTVSVTETTKYWDYEPMAPYDRSGNFSNDETNMFAAILREPAVDWAVANSFDGIYIQRMDDVSNFSRAYVFKVYLKEDHCTFWKLKF